MRGLVKLRLLESNGEIRINPDEVVRISARDSYRPNGACVVHMKDGVRHTVYENAEEAQLKVEAQLS
jgi:hypothetical protein